MLLKNYFKSAAVLAMSVAALATADESSLRVGVVNYTTCMENSCLGKDESSKLESLRNEMVSMMDEKQKAFQEISEKLGNPDYMDTLSPEADKELHAKAKALAEELQYLSFQTNQAFQQAQEKMIQNVVGEIQKASEYIAREKNLDFILNKDGCCYFKKPADITPLVIKELDRHYQPETSKEEAK